MTPSISQSKPRRFRFSLRTFFVLLTAFCVWLGWQIHQAKQQREAAVKWVEKHAFVVRRGPESMNQETEDRGWTFGWLEDGMADEIVEVWITRADVKDITPLADLSRLKLLRLKGTQVSDLRPLANLESLEHLDLSDTAVRDLSPLANLPRLRGIDLDGTQVTDLAPLSTVATLEGLRCSNTQVSNLAPLAKLPRLEYLDFSNTKVNQIKPLTKLKTLTHVEMRECPAATRLNYNVLQKALPQCYVPYWLPIY